jgi:hypothetical protein
MNIKLKNYVSIISNNSLVAEDDYIPDENESLIYKLILSYKDRKELSRKFTKKLINKLRVNYPVIKNKTDKNLYIAKQIFNNDLIILEYHQGDLKDRYKSIK